MKRKETKNCARWCQKKINTPEAVCGLNRKAVCKTWPGAGGAVAVCVRSIEAVCKTGAGAGGPSGEWLRSEVPSILLGCALYSSPAARGKTVDWSWRAPMTNERPIHLFILFILNYCYA